ncbi:ABC transporter permease [Paenibacillus lautus]|uniref:ABC transporter permease n=1 Tax=Paenibacillus lautus TaxID=1401 RepID=UPI002DC014F0|nr:ABC transporter permease [Paenibacillus lautus]MEC0310688.1 ABC transporter permease [Paenibacillus lautus]
MSRFKRVFLFVIAVIAMIGSFSILEIYNRSNYDVLLSFEVKSEFSDDYQVFYSKDNLGWEEQNSLHMDYNTPGEWKTLEYQIPKDSTQLRIDFGMNKGNILLRSLIISTNSQVPIYLERLKEASYNQLQLKNVLEDRLEMYSLGNDPYIEFSVQQFIHDSVHNTSYSHKVKNIVISIIFSGLIVFITRYLKTSLQFLRTITANNRLILNLARNDFKTKYASSYLGVIWGFVNPLLTILTYWFVFQVGLRSGNVSEVPFILWFITGIVPWFFFAEAFSGATNSLQEYSYLVKKVVFKIELLPIVKIVSALFVHLFFIGFLFVVFAAYSYYPTIYNFQFLYYSVCLTVLVLSLSILTAAVVLFFKDLGQIITIILQMGFWFTPIGWPVTMLSDFWAYIFKLNPVFYIVQGYRDTFIDKILFYERPYETLYFWILSLSIFTLGTVVFRKLKPHFADVL